MNNLEVDTSAINYKLRPIVLNGQCNTTMVLEKILYFSHEYLWNKDADQPVEKYVHMSMVIGESRLGTIFTNYTVYGSSVAPAVARSPSLITILISISRM